MVKAQLLKLQPIAREMRGFDVVVSQSIGAVSESSFEFVYAIREADNRATDYAGKLLATALAVCVPVAAPGVRLPISDRFRELVTQTREALLRDNKTGGDNMELFGDAGIRVRGAPIGALPEGGTTAANAANSASNDEAAYAADRQLMKDMLTVQLPEADLPTTTTTVDIPTHMMSMPGEIVVG